MGTTRIERAIDEFDTAGDEFEPTCDAIRLAWLAHEPNADNDFDAIWTDR